VNYKFTLTMHIEMQCTRNLNVIVNSYLISNMLLFHEIYFFKCVIDSKEEQYIIYQILLKLIAKIFEITDKFIINL
jgi:hypothetical protein